ncbi:hypothetical protein D3C72_1929960 [compost metagenome]
MLQMNAFAFDQIARQPAVHAPQVGEKRDVKQANHPKMWGAEQFAAQLFTFGNSRFTGGAGRWTCHVKVTHTKQHQ